MNSNKFELTGRLNFIEYKALETGTVIARLLISKKIKDDVYESYSVSLFNDNAEKCSGMEKGNYIYVSGKMQINKYTDKNGTNREEIRLIGFEVKKVKYDVITKTFVEDAGETKTEKMPWEK
jgi:single-stranded DNA-binding protein